MRKFRRAERLFNYPKTWAKMHMPELGPGHDLRSIRRGTFNISINNIEIQPHKILAFSWCLEGFCHM